MNEKKESSRVKNTTPFQNREPFKKNINNLGNVRSRIVSPSNNSLDNSRTRLEKKDDNSNLSNEEKSQKARDYLNSVDNNQINSKKNRIPNILSNTPKLGSNGNNLRDSLNTKPSDLKDAKENASKIGAEALKKSANPYAKALGYAASFRNKQKEKKKAKEDLEETKEKENDNDNNEASVNETESEEKREVLLKKLLPLLIILLPILLILILLFVIIAPILSGFSWFYDVFTTYNDNDVYQTQVQDELATEKTAFKNAIVGSKDGSVKGIIQEYQEKYGVTIDKYLLVATVTYKYTEGKEDNLYVEDGSVDDAEFTERLESLDGNTENSSNNTIDYKAAEKKIRAVASLMVTKNGDFYSTDNNIGGNFYNTLIDSNFLKTYYKDMLVNMEYETRKKLVDNIFEYAETGKYIIEEDDDNFVNGGVVGETSIVYLQSCTEPKQYQTKFVGNHEIYDNKLVNEGTNYPLYLSLKDYIKGVIYRENFSTDEKYRESIKVQAIMALSFLLRDSKSGFDLKNGEMYFPTETCRQATCDPNYGCTSVDGVASYSGTDRGNGTPHRALNEKEQAYLNSILDEVFGLVIVKKGVTSSSFSGSGDLVSFNYCNTLGACSSCISGSCVGQTEANNDSASGMDYKAIFAKYFTSLEYDIIDIREGLYTTTSFINASFKGNFVYYSQTNYKDVTFCGRNGRSISSSGCGVTSAAMVASSLTNNTNYDPVYMMNWAHRTGHCGSGIDGTSAGFFETFSNGLGLKYQKVGKENTDIVVNSLKNGNTLVIAHMGPGHFTTGGHYIVLAGLNDKGEVYVEDPNNNRRTGYWDINLIANELQSHGKFHIISR